jgi:hypothetical protein
MGARWWAIIEARSPDMKGTVVKARTLLLGLWLAIFFTAGAGCSSKEKEPVKKEGSPFQGRFKPIRDAKDAPTKDAPDTGPKDKE